MSRSEAVDLPSSDRAAIRACLAPRGVMDRGLVASGAVAFSKTALCCWHSLFFYSCWFVGHSREAKALPQRCLRFTLVLVASP